MAKMQGLVTVRSQCILRRRLSTLATQAMAGHTGEVQLPTGSIASAAQPLHLARSVEHAELGQPAQTLAPSQRCYFRDQCDIMNGASCCRERLCRQPMRDGTNSNSKS